MTLPASNERHIDNIVEDFLSDLNEDGTIKESSTNRLQVIIRDAILIHRDAKSRKGLEISDDEEKREILHQLNTRQDRKAGSGYPPIQEIGRDLEISNKSMNVEPPPSAQRLYDESVRIFNRRVEARKKAAHIVGFIAKVVKIAI